MMREKAHVEALRWVANLYDDFADDPAVGMTVGAFAGMTIEDLGRLMRSGWRGADRESRNPPRNEGDS